jgi:hypothetical protein
MSPALLAVGVGIAVCVLWLAFRRAVTARGSSSRPIESLWTFSEKFQSERNPRHACYDSPEHILLASLAVARA